MPVAKLTPMEIALSQLIMGHPFYATLALRLERVEAPELPTYAGTDGHTLWYNPEMFNSLSRPEQIFVLAHEVSHCIFQHVTRRGTRDADLWNCAGDYVINLELKDCRMTMPKDGLIDERFRGMNADQVYKILEGEQKKKKKGPGKCCSLKDAPGDAAAKEALGKEWVRAVQQAAMTAFDGFGKLPASIQRLLEQAQPKNDWRPILHRYLVKQGDFAWSKPNRRFIGQGLYLPGTTVDSLRCIVFGIDTSGSVDGKMLSLFGGEVKGILAQSGHPERLVALWCDSQIQRVQELTEDWELKPAGGGGTAFQPVFDWVEKEQLIPEVLFYLTDLEGPMPKDPGYPVVWVVPEGCKRAVPFGEVVEIF